ncbi:hypothetical protein ZYGR_0AG07090 [Zygosaccharomyces rouxii]|uniref:NAD-dependent epimerase/dehydratase domain-containing protein n=1 Tax=Zygosaccharomyces rouxii TaxID=4956 RepID=A0A1Q3AAR1_ZYGRO|nr:hypothetical protein ZYGR_0AG07090 [Zygosaccharomyces rouxii]
MAVLVTGATGFIGEHVVDLLLKEGLDVIGTTRSAEKAKKVHAQFKNNSKLSFEIVPELTASDAFDNVFCEHGKRIQNVIHMASPFISGATDFENQLLAPARNGTIAIFNGIEKYGKNVKRVVFTSSLLTLADSSKLSDEGSIFRERDWSSATWETCQGDPMSAYGGSKKFAEKAAWEFVESHKDKIGFKLAVVVPSMVLGPHKFEEDVKVNLNLSNRIIDSLLNTSPNQTNLPKMCAPFIDVRDVARAHLVALRKESAVNQRICVFKRTFGSQDILDILNYRFPGLRGKISLGPDPRKGDQTPSCNYDTSFSNKILGFEFKTLEESVCDTVAQVLNVRGDT